ncbi:MAG: hypothetical protein HGN29_16700 [Asgard group archaeon]|nr:hypothetical protein [Asgard group archaeon]
MSETKRKTLNHKIFLAIYIGITLVALLLVIPNNLTMRGWGMNYYLVPFFTSLLCCLLPLFLSFPFFDLSRQKINRSLSRYKFFSKRTYTHLLFIIIIPVALYLVIHFYLSDPSPSYYLRFPFILSTIAIPISYITTISTMMVFEQLSLPENSVKQSDVRNKSVLTWIVFSLLILTTIFQSCELLSYFIYGITGAIYLIIFIIAFVLFLKKERVKLKQEDENTSKSLFMQILQFIYIIVTILYFSLIILYSVFLVKGYLIITFDEFYSGFFLAIQGSYVLFLIIFYSIIYWIMIRKKIFE